MNLEFLGDDEPLAEATGDLVPFCCLTFWVFKVELRARLALSVFYFFMALGTLSGRAISF